MDSSGHLINSWADIMLFSFLHLMPVHYIPLKEWNIKSFALGPDKETEMISQDIFDQIETQEYKAIISFKTDIPLVVHFTQFMAF